MKDPDLIIKDLKNYLTRNFPDSEVRLSNSNKDRVVDLVIQLLEELKIRRTEEK